MVEPHCSNFRVIRTNFLGIRIFRKFTVHLLCHKSDMAGSFNSGDTKINKLCFVFLCTHCVHKEMYKQYVQSFEPRHDKTNKVTVRPAKTQIRVFAVRMKKPWVLSYPLSRQRRL